MTLERNLFVIDVLRRKYANPVLLVIDESLLLKRTLEKSKFIFEILHHRRKKSSTIFCSQYRQEGWYEKLGGDPSPVAEAIFDRIVHDSCGIRRPGPTVLNPESIHSA